MDWIQVVKIQIGLDWVSKNGSMSNSATVYRITWIYQRRCTRLRWCELPHKM